MGSKSGPPPMATTTVAMPPTLPANEVRPHTDNLATRGAVASHSEAVPRPTAQARLRETAAKPTPNAPGKPLSHEGQGEVHLGIHAAVESSAPPDQGHPATPNPVSTLSDSTPAEPQKPAETSEVAGTPTVTEHGSPTALGEHNLLASESSRAKETAANAVGSMNDGKSVSAKSFVSGSPRKHESTAHASLHASHDAPQGQTQSSSLSPANSGMETPGVPVAGGTSAARQTPAEPMAVPISEQLTRAFVAQAEVVQREGRTDFHLRLDPPQLGSVRIHLTAMDHIVSARVVAAQEGTRQLLEGQAHHLRQGLAAAGLSLGSFDVTRDGGGSHSRQPPAEPTPSLPFAVSTPRTVTVSTPLPHPREGIDLLA